MDRKGIAFETLQILEQGSYQSPSGRSVDIAADLLACVTNTECHTPNDLAGIRDQVLQRPAEYDATFFEVENETTLRGSARLAASHVNSRIGVLNFASAKNPGGGFRGGAQAQEESLTATGHTSRIHEKGARNHSLTKAQKSSNKAKSRVRARIEHVFGSMTNELGGITIRTIGLMRAKVQIGLLNLVYNIKRVATLIRKKHFNFDRVIAPEIA